MGTPYMKFLSLINPDEASVDFHAIRGGVPKKNITYTGISGATSAASNGLSQDISSSLELVGRLFPIMLGIVALNALILLILVVGGIVFYCRRRRTSVAAARARTPRGRMSPMPMNVRHTFPGNFQSPQQAHTYESVSMALTEDAFVPPSPAFHNRDGNRDRSNFRSSQQAHTYEPVSMALTEDTFVPSSPTSSFHKLDGNHDRYSQSSQQARTNEPVSMAMTEDTFVPPSPAFHKQDGNRNSFKPTA